MNKNFKDIQHELGVWLRGQDSSSHPFDSVEPRRLAIYKRLIHNNIQQFLRAGFPVLQEVLSAAQWQRLNANFIAHHQAYSPLFSDIGAELVDFLATLDEPQRLQNELPPWLFELAHYERVEVDVLHAHFDDSLQEVETITETTVLYLNSTAQVAIYNYPVASISRTQLPDEVLAEPYCVLVYREPGAEQVRFMQLNHMTAGVLAELQTNPLTFSQLFEVLLVQYPEQEPQALASGLLQLVQDFCERFVLFTRP